MFIENLFFENIFFENIFFENKEMPKSYKTFFSLLVLTD